MQLTVDRTFLLQVAQQQIPGDPDVTDWGSTAAAVARHSDEVMDKPVYPQPHHRAAALFHSLVRVPALEHSNGLFACAVAAGFLTACGLPCAVTTKAAISLVERTASGELDVRQVADELRTWTETER